VSTPTVRNTFRTGPGSPGLGDVGSNLARARMRRRPDSRGDHKTGHPLLPCSLMLATIFCAAPAASDAEKRSAAASNEPKVVYIVSTRHFSSEDLAAIRSQSVSSETIPLWSYSITAYDGRTYQGEMVGRSPYAHGHRSTTIPTYVIPVVFTFADTNTVFDPTAGNVCSPNGGNVLSLVHGSPIFQNAAFSMNGVNVGNTQYLDAFQRGNFWSLVAGTPYHTVFSSNPPVLPAVKVTVPVEEGSTQVGFCRPYGKMNEFWWDNLLRTTIIPGLASEGVGPANFAQFIFDSVVMYLGDPSQCCVGGYHSSYLNNGVFQTYSANFVDTSGVFGGGTTAMSHEVAEWMDDPTGGNPVPGWGAEGSVHAPFCQINLEVGDPLSPGFGTPTNPFSVSMPNGVTYTLQELAYVSWFYGQVPSLGSGGGYSDNGTFLGYAKPCPPGGTN